MPENSKNNSLLNETNKFFGTIFIIISFIAMLAVNFYQTRTNVAEIAAIKLSMHNSAISNAKLQERIESIDRELKEIKTLLLKNYEVR